MEYSCTHYAALMQGINSVGFSCPPQADVRSEHNPVPVPVPNLATHVSYSANPDVNLPNLSAALPATFLHPSTSTSQHLSYGSGLVARNASYPHNPQMLKAMASLKRSSSSSILDNVSYHAESPPGLPTLPGSSHPTSAKDSWEPTIPASACVSNNAGEGKSQRNVRRRTGNTVHPLQNSPSGFASRNPALQLHPIRADAPSQLSCNPLSMASQHGIISSGTSPSSPIMLDPTGPSNSCQLSTPTTVSRSASSYQTTGLSASLQGNLLPMEIGPLVPPRQLRTLQLPLPLPVLQGSGRNASARSSFNMPLPSITEHGIRRTYAYPSMTAASIPTTVQARRNRIDPHHDMRLDIDNMSYEELLALGERIGNVSTGLPEDQISRCLAEAIFISKESNDGADDGDEETCVICLEEYKDWEGMGTLKCGHDFHSSCAKEWLKMKKSCPVCKADVLGDSSNQKPA